MQSSPAIVSNNYLSGAILHESIDNLRFVCPDEGEFQHLLPIAPPDDISFEGIKHFRPDEALQCLDVTLRKRPQYRFIGPPGAGQKCREIEIRVDLAKRILGHVRTGCVFGTFVPPRRCSVPLGPLVVPAGEELAPTPKHCPIKLIATEGEQQQA